MRVRFGFQRIHVLLRREGWAVKPQAGAAALLAGEIAVAAEEEAVEADVPCARQPGMCRLAGPTLVDGFRAPPVGEWEPLRVLTVVDQYTRDASAGGESGPLLERSRCCS